MDSYTFGTYGGLLLEHGVHNDGYLVPHTGSWRRQSPYPEAQQPQRIGDLHQWTIGDYQRGNGLEFKLPTIAGQDIRHGTVEIWFSEVSTTTGNYGYGKFNLDLQGTNNGIDLVDDFNTKFAATDTASKMCLYSIAGLADVRVKNNTGTTCKISVKAVYTRTDED